MGNPDGDHRRSHERHCCPAGPPERDHRHRRREGERCCCHPAVVVPHAVDVTAGNVLEAEERRCIHDRNPPEQAGGDGCRQGNAVQPDQPCTPSVLDGPQQQHGAERQPGPGAEDVTGAERCNKDHDGAGKRHTPHRQVVAPVGPDEDRHGPQRQVLHRTDSVVNAVDDLGAVPEPTERIGSDCDDHHAADAVAPESSQQGETARPPHRFSQAVPRPV